MDAVTYPHALVTAELSNWVLVKIDITENRSAAETLQVTAVPVAVAVTSTGRELGRLPNFLDPESFHERLRGLRAAGVLGPEPLESGPLAAPRQ